MKYVILVTGDRNWSNAAKVGKELFKRKDKIAFVIGGGARGLDTIAEERTKLLGLPFIRVEASWDFYGKAAGPIRNKWMLKILRQLKGKKLVLAFHHNIKASKGTRNMIQQAEEAGIRVKLIT
jgi:hypothetical protein